jgi:hypothetical protein
MAMRSVNLCCYCVGAQVLSDSQLQPFFEGIDLAHLKRQQAQVGCSVCWLLMSCQWSLLQAPSRFLSSRICQFAVWRHSG